MRNDIMNPVVYFANLLIDLFNISTEAGEAIAVFGGITISGVIVLLISSFFAWIIDKTIT